MKTIRRITSIVLTVMVLFVFEIGTPAHAVVETAKQQSTIIAYSAANDFSGNQKLAYSPLVGEDLTGRGESARSFRRADGITEAVMYSMAVNYLEQGEWKAIDNTLDLVKQADGTQAYTNRASDLHVYFADQFDSRELVRVESNGNTLSWRFISDERELTSGAKAKVIEEEPENEGSPEDKDMELRFPKELSSTLKYTDEEAGLNIQYMLSGKTLSEHIILEKAPEQAVQYTEEITGKGLQIKEAENGYILINEQGETVFRLPCPVMYDAAGEGSDRIEVIVTPVDENEGVFRYTLVPDIEWLQSTDRQYPVYVDPDIKVESNSDFQDTFVSSGSPNANYSTLGYMRASQGNICLIRIPVSIRPTLNSGDVILEAALNLNRYNANSSYANKDVELSPITAGQTWNTSNVTWNTKPTYDTTKVWSLGISSVPYMYTPFDITELVKDWYSVASTSAQTLDVALYNTGSYSDFFTSEYSGTAARKPYLSVLYRNSTGIEDTWKYYSQDIGRAGTGSVNVFTGNMTLIHEDAGISNGALPVSLSHVYNANDKAVDIGYGNGWRLNYSQSVAEVALPNGATTTTYFEYTDGDGTRHYYKADGTSTTNYINELDKDSTLTVGTSTITIKDKGDNELVFEYGTYSGKRVGRLTTVRDANGNETRISYVSSTDKNDLKISSIQEMLSGNSTGQQLTLAYTSSRLSSVTVPNGLNVSYTYTSGRLTGIGYADGKTTVYTYNSAGCMTKAANIDGYNILYEYTGDPARVTKITEATGSVIGQYLTLTYGRNKTAIEDEQSRKTVYHMDNLGQAVSITDPDGRAVYAAYNTDPQTVTQLSAVSKVQDTVGNPLKNHGFEESTYPSSWTRSNTTYIRNDSSRRHTGAYSCKMTAGSQDRVLSQAVSVTSGEVYTLSAYFSGTLNTAYMRITNGSVTEQTPAIEAGGTGWNRESFTFRAAASSITVAIVVPAGSGDVYVDSIQLEKGEIPHRYNLIMNSDFTSGTSNYTLNYGSDCAVINVANAKYAEARDTHPAMLDDNVYEMNGKLQAIKIRQTYLSGDAGDTYTFGAWAASNSVPLSDQLVYYGSSGSNHVVEYGIKRMTLQFLNSSNVVVCSGSVDFAADTNEWQFASGTVTATTSYAHMELIIEYTRSLNVMYIDGIQLYKEQFSQGYEYDSSGNLVGTASLIGQTNSFEYDNSNNLIESTDARGNTTTYTYDTHHNLLTATSPEGVVTTNTYNSKGLVTETKVGNSTDYIRSTRGYDTNGLTTSVTDARGKTVTYTYDNTNNTRQLEKIKDPKNNETTYAYGNAANMRRLASVGSTDTGTVAYTYDTYGKLTDVTRGGTVYKLVYDSWSRVLQTKVGSTALVTNTYDAHDRLDTVTYANAFSAKYEYDDMDRVKEIWIKKAGQSSYSLAFQYLYNGDGTLYERRDYQTMRAATYAYDHQGRCVKATERYFTDANGFARYTSTRYGFRYEYDPNNNLSKLVHEVAGTTWETVYTYDNDNRSKTVTFASGKILTNTYDGMGRVTQKRLGLSSNYDTTLTYVAGTNSSKTALLSTYQNGSDTAYTYAYDDNGNITSITRGSTSVTYQYNGANELIRENNGFTNQTVTYEYDSWGNITEKEIYAYTTATNPGTPTSTIPYSYTNSTWGDQMTQYNGQAISYDAMGNPTTYRGKTLTWNGKELTGVTGTASYTYDMNGLRTTKTVGGTTTNYFYNNTVLMGLTTGTTYLLFSYDASGLVQAVNYNGTYYYYLRNGQGDIVKLIDGSGNAVVEYTYDSWGKQLSCTGTLATTLGVLNPFRYRGYVYDEETQWYYLRSRYYDPETCRFISADVYLSTGQGVLGHNCFAYCGNNAVSRSDSVGTCWEEIWEWIKSLFSNGGNDNSYNYASESQTTAAIEITISAPQVTPMPSAPYPPVIDKYISNAREMIGDPYNMRDCAQLVRASVLDYDPDFVRGARYQWSKYNSELWDRQFENDLSKIPSGALLYYANKDNRIVHTAIYLGKGRMIDSTDKKPIYGVSERSAYSSLTYQNKPIAIVGYLYPKQLFK